MPTVADLSVVVPVRNAEALVADCLASIAEAGPAEIIVVDGLSTDNTKHVARRHGAVVLSDEGRGLPAARAIGARAARSQWVALIDVDVIVPDGALESLFQEFLEGGYTGLQAGLWSTSGSGYWGQSLAHHHRTGRSRKWFGVVATIFERETLLRYGFDDRFLSGEDIELRWRLERKGDRFAVSERTTVIHRFVGDTFEFARDQFLADGEGLGRMVGKHRRRALWLMALPLAAGLRGIVLSLARRQPRWVPYYVCFTGYNYVGMIGALRRW